jgi:hypothetical protein
MVYVATEISTLIHLFIDLENSQTTHHRAQNISLQNLFRISDNPIPTRYADGQPPPVLRREARETCKLRISKTEIKLFFPVLYFNLSS